MGFTEQVKQFSVNEQGGEFSVEIGFSRLEREFTETDRVLVLYSNIKYSCEDFTWGAEVPTVRIPYKDPSMGFLMNGKLQASLGIYQRAPGVVTGVDKRTVSSKVIEEPKVDIVTSRNSTLSIGYKRNGIQITFKRSGKEQRVPIGIFLKAISGLPYSIIQDRIAYKSQHLLNGFPCEVTEGNVDLSKVALYDSSNKGCAEPSIEDCVAKVYNAIGAAASQSSTNYSVHWKKNRIQNFLDGLHFKTVQNYETRLSLAFRSVGTYLNEELRLPMFVDDGAGNVMATEFCLEKGHYITASDAQMLARLDISTLRVKTSRSFILQEDTPVVFRVQGYKLGQDIPELHNVLHTDDTTGMLITPEVLDVLNESNLHYLEVITPTEHKTVYRAPENITVGDFITILNYLCTDKYTEHEDASQYEVGNRVVRDYDGQVMMEVRQTYEDIVTSLAGVSDLRHVIESLPALPSNGLCNLLRSVDNKNVVQAEITNIMSRAIADTTASALLQEAPGAMMLVQKDQYGRMDALHSPDSKKVGAVQHMTVQSKINPSTGDVEAPYEVITNGKPTGKIVYVPASAEVNKYIVAWNEDFSKDVVQARFNGDVTTVRKTQVHYRDPSPYCDMSVSRMCIPFPGFSQPKRAIMATKMNGQALPLLHPQRPIVSTGAETEIPGLYYTGRQILEASNIPAVEGSPIELVGTEWSKYVVTHRFIHAGSSFEFAVPYTCTDKESLYNYNLNLNIKKASTYELDDVVLYNQSCDIGAYETWERLEQGALPLVKDAAKPAMALGTNLRMCYKTMGTSTLDDAVLISERLVDDHVLSTIQILRYDLELKAGESLSMDGNAKLHSHVYSGQPLITISRRGEEGTGERCVLCKQEGDVVYVDTNINNSRGSKVEVWVASLHDAEVGDKVAGRYGNKSVIARIVPDYMMPYDPDDGLPMDIVCTPEGLPSRMNFGQVLECALGAVMSKQSKVAVVSPFYPDIKKQIQDEYNAAGLQPKRLFLPEYGKLSERPVMTGVLYFMKLEQIANTKIRAIGYPRAVDAVFGEPVKSVNRPKGQAIGEYESWALEAAGARRTLNNLFTFYAGDEENRRRYFNMLAANKDDAEGDWDEYEGSRDGVGDGLVTQKGQDINSLAMQVVLRMFGLDVDMDKTGGNYKFVPLDLKRIQVVQSLQNIKDDSFKLSETAWSKAPLEAPVVNPFWVEYFPLAPILGMKSLKSLVDGKHYIHRNYDSQPEGRVTIAKNKIAETGNPAEHYMTGMSALIDIIKNTTLEMAERFLTGGMPVDGRGVIVRAESDLHEEILDEFGVPIVQEQSEVFDIIPEVEMSTADLLKFLRCLKDNGMTLVDLIWYELPVIPRVFCQPNVVGNNVRDHSFQKYITRILSYSTSQEVYQSLREFVGYGEGNRDNWQSIRGYFFGKGSATHKHGAIRNDVLSKRVGFSGRAVITPAQDPYMTPFFVKLPWRIALIELADVLAIRLKKREDAIASHLQHEASVPANVVTQLEQKDWVQVIESLYKFNSYVLGNVFKVPEHSLVIVYHYLRSVIKQIIEGNVTRDGLVWYKGEYRDPRDLPEDATIDCAMVIFGRQPTLHKKSLRAFFALLCDGDTIQLHHTVCEAYNADFDGDTMYTVQLFGSSKNEACKTISVMQDLISEKDGSYTLALIQDVALGIYCATTYKNNAPAFEGRPGDYVYFNDLDELRMQLEYGDLPYYRPVVYDNGEHWYCSTAGRILLNASVPGCLTSASFTDSWGIAKAVMGEGVDLSKFRELKYDMPWVTTKERPKGREKAVKLGDIQLEVYEIYGERQSIITTQKLFEIGVIASDVYSVSISMDDMHVDTSYGPTPENPNGGDRVEDCLKVPQDTVKKLNSLYQMGLISDEQRRESAIKAWDTGRKSAQEEIIGRLDPMSNTYYMMYSGARGKPAQIMQTVGFVGTVSKTSTEDIELPILLGYGQGLNSLDLARTNYSARIGVIATQAGTQDTGYATRQSVYMTSGMRISEDDCIVHLPEEHLRGVHNSRVCTVRVEYGGAGKPMCLTSDGRAYEVSELVGDIYLSGAPRSSRLAAVLGRSGFFVNEEAVELMCQEADLEMEFESHGKCRIGQPAGVSPEWREYAIEKLYSYALPFTVDMKITKETVDWIEQEGMLEVVAFEKDLIDRNEVFHLEAYLPTEYDSKQRTLTTNGEVHGEEIMFTRKVDPSSEGYRYYERLLEDNHLTAVALNYLAKKRIHSVKFEDGTETRLTYKLSRMFRDISVGRVSEGLPYLLDDGTITPETLDFVEKYQLEYIPIYTGVTCLSPDGICKKCYGLSMSTKRFIDVGTNLGITSSQTMSEPLSQATLNVGHSGGQRAMGTAQLSGLSFFTGMLQGKMGTERTKTQMEMFASQEGYVVQNQHSRNFIQIVSDDGRHSEPISIDDASRLNVPNGAYVNEGDTIVAGLPDLNRFKGTYVYGAALKTRMMLLREYYRVFSSLDVSTRNVEVLVRAQTSNCYAIRFTQDSQEKTRDTALESVINSGCYVLRVSTQPETVMRYTGVASFAFQHVGNMLASGVLNPESLKLNSFLGNIVTGTEIGSVEPKFLERDSEKLRSSSRVMSQRRKEVHNRGMFGSNNAGELNPAFALPTFQQEMGTRLCAIAGGGDSLSAALTDGNVTRVASLAGILNAHEQAELEALPQPKPVEEDIVVIGAPEEALEEEESDSGDVVLEIPTDDVEIVEDDSDMTNYSKGRELRLD